MRTLESVNEFKIEAEHAVFNKQQAVAATLQLLQKEISCPANTPEDTKVLQDAMAKAEFRYIDATTTDTDRMLDELGVARFTTGEIANAIESLLFDVK